MVDMGTHTYTHLVVKIGCWIVAKHLLHSVAHTRERNAHVSKVLLELHSLLNGPTRRLRSGTGRTKASQPSGSFHSIVGNVRPLSLHVNPHQEQRTSTILFHRSSAPGSSSSSFTLVLLYVTSKTSVPPPPPPPPHVPKTKPTACTTATSHPPLLRLHGLDHLLARIEAPLGLVGLVLVHHARHAWDHLPTHVRKKSEVGHKHVMPRGDSWNGQTSRSQPCTSFGGQA